MLFDILASFENKAIQIALIAIIGLFALEQTRRQPLPVAFVCLLIFLACTSVTMELVNTDTQTNEVIIKKTTEIIEITELIQSQPIEKTIEEIEYRVIGGASAQPKTDGTVDWSQVWPAQARWQKEVQAASQHCNIPESLIIAMMRQESGGDPNTCSTAGACGLMQLMPGTAKMMAVVNVFDPGENVRGGACYFAQHLKRYNDDVDLALAAYNAGPGNVDLHGGIPPFRETQKYIRNVNTFLQQIPKKEPGQAVTSATDGFIWPVNAPISQQPSAAHMALDLACALGSPILASKDGRVTAVGWDNTGYGKRIIVDHGDGYQTLSAHLSSFNVKLGDQVSQGTMLGRSGSTGKSTGPHLHFEIRHNGTLLNPLSHLPKE